MAISVSLTVSDPGLISGEVPLNSFEENRLKAVEQCLAQLLEGQREIHNQQNGEISPSLVLADSLLRYQQARSKFSGSPLKNIVVIGPTQSGKSTTVNWLSGEQVAVADALAGFTRHAQGFSTAEVSSELRNSLSEFFVDWTMLEQNQLSDNQLNAWSIQSLNHEKSQFENVIIWDTPDFDSVSSSEYRNVSMKMLALADVIVFMVSKEKYADQTVWNTLKTIEPVKIPLLICLNKTSEAAAEEILPELDRRLQEANLLAPVVTIPYLENMGHAGEYENNIRQSTQRLLSEAKHRDIEESVKALARLHWSDWSSSAYAENEQLSNWQELVSDSMEEACQHYEKNYLQGSHYEATLQKAMIRLLELLEVPGIAESLVHARQMLTWPARKLRGMFSNGKAMLDGKVEKQDAERVVLNEALSQLLTSLQHNAGKNIAAEQSQEKQWWMSVFNAIEDQKPGITKAFESSVEQYQEAFSVEIEAAAQSLYEHLKENPAKLNSLRAARVTTDAAAVVLALKTGGIGLNDLVLTPAMLSFVSMLTEGALGKYMKGVEKKLKQAQKEAVCNELIHGQLKLSLAQIELRMSRQGLVNLPEELLIEAEKILGV